MRIDFFFHWISDPLSIFSQCSAVLPLSSMMSLYVYRLFTAFVLHQFHTVLNSVVSLERLDTGTHTSSLFIFNTALAIYVGIALNLKMDLNKNLTLATLSFLFRSFKISFHYMKAFKFFFLCRGLVHLSYWYLGIWHFEAISKYICFCISLSVLWVQDFMLAFISFPYFKDFFYSDFHCFFPLLISLLLWIRNDFYYWLLGFFCFGVQFWNTFRRSFLSI